MATIHGKKVKIFSLSANPELAQEIAECMGLGLSDCTISRFADGEINVNIGETVRGYDVFVVQPTSAPANDHYMELLIFVDALKRASAKTINVVMPYYGYSRQDRKALARQPISAKLMADLLQTAGITRVVCMDLHAAQIQGFFDVPIDNFEALPIMVPYIKKKKLQDMVIVAPDHGAASRARKFANCFNAPLAIIDKRRPAPNVVEVMNIIGDVKDKNAIIVDDIIDTAGTLTEAAKALIKAGAKAVYAVATHPVLSGPAIERIQNSPIKELITTNSIRLSEEKKIPKIKQLSIAKQISQGLLNIIDDKSVSALFQYKPEQNF